MRVYDKVKAGQETAPQHAPGYRLRPTESGSVLVVRSIWRQTPPLPGLCPLPHHKLQMECPGAQVDPRTTCESGRTEPSGLDGRWPSENVAGRRQMGRGGPPSCRDLW